MDQHEAGPESKVHHWKGYWRIAGGELIIHTAQGNDINFREVSDFGMNLCQMCCDDWEVVEENENVSEESVKAAGEHIAVRKADTTAHELEKLKSMVSAADALSSAIDKWNEEKKSWEVHQNEREHPD